VTTTATQRNLTNRRLRGQCLDCCAGEPKGVTWCPCDGVHSTRCELWPFRFGMSPAKAAKRYGRHVVAPELMPPANANLDDLPANPRNWSPGDRTDRRTGSD
jgi:hypothetical protein